MTDFGTDLSCVTDLTDDMAMVTGRLLLGQAIARRLGTPRGGLIDDPNYGFDLRGYLNDDMSPTDVGRLQASAAAECVKDERVQSATVTTVLPATGVMIVTVALVDAAGPFTLVLSVSDVTVQLISVK